MARQLDEKTLNSAARHYAAEFMRPGPSIPHSHVPGKWIRGREYVMQDFYNFTFKDEFEHLLKAVRKALGSGPLAEFDALAAERFAPRSDEILETLLRERLAVDRNGVHVDGAVGSVQRGQRYVGTRVIEVESPASLRFRRWARSNGRDPGERQTVRRLAADLWPVYAGELEERARGSDAVDELPPDADPWPVGHVLALNTRISNEIALLMCDAAVDNLDEGTGAAVIRGYTGVQPTDPDTAPTGTLLFTLVMSDPAFGAAVDVSPGGRATAGAITGDTSADDTGTLGYCRTSSTNDSATPLDDHLDGEAGTSGADFNFNTLSIVSGAAVDMTSYTVTQPEG